MKGEYISNDETYTISGITKDELMQLYMECELIALHSHSQINNLRRVLADAYYAGVFEEEFSENNEATSSQETSNYFIQD